MLDRLRAVTAEEVTRAAQKYFTRDNRTVGFLIDDTDEISNLKS